MTVALVEASEGRGGPPFAELAEPVYEPGEDDRFLGGTDAVDGELLFVAGRSPVPVTAAHHGLEGASATYGSVVVGLVPRV